MLKKSITYEDFNGNTTTEDHYFHLSKADLVEMEVTHDGGMAKWLQTIVNANDARSIIGEFKKLILESYGKRSDDGRRFIKTAALREEFESSEAYSTLFLELCTNADAAAEFVNGIVPANLEQEMAKVTRAEEGHPSDVAATMADPGNVGTTRNVFERGRDGEDVIPEKQGPRVLSMAEAEKMDSDELRSGLATGRYTLGG